VTRVPSDVPRVTFLLKFRNVHGIGSSESTRFPDSVGEFRKARHPRNVEVNEICDASFQGQRTHDDMESGIHEVSKSRMRGE
jgi:hypothetical protein